MTMMKRMTRYLLLALLAAAFGAQADNFRWGDSNTSNRMLYGPSHVYLKPDNGRVYLYLGEAKRVNNQVALDGLTYICDATARSTSDPSFGNYKDSDKYLNHDLISAEGGQKFSLISVSLSLPTKVKAGQPIQPGPYFSVAIKTGTSVAKEDGAGNKYASLVLSEQFVNGDYSGKGAFVDKVVPPQDGGYMWGSPVALNCKVPKYDTGVSVKLNDTTAKTYVYLGKAEYKYGAINIAKLTYLTNSIPLSTGNFGNYAEEPTFTSQLIQDDRVNFNGGQDYTIFIVTPDAEGDMPPDQLEVGYKAKYIAMITGTGKAAVASDGAKHAQFYVSTATKASDFYADVKLVDKDVEPYSVKGFMWGSTVAGSYRLPYYSSGSASTLGPNTARAYVYLGKAEFKNGAVNFANLTYLTNSVPQSSGLFGNYAVPPVFTSQLIMNDRIDPNGGQDFTIFIVTPSKNDVMPPNPLSDGYEANYIAIQTGTSVQAISADGAKHAQLIMTTATTVNDYKHLVPLVDVSGATFGVY